MLKIFLILLFQFHQPAKAEDFFKLQNKQNPVYLVEINHHQISKSNCEKACIAKEIAEHKAPIPKKITPDDRGTGRGTLICQAMKAISGQLYDAENNEIAICIFKDKSFILTEDLEALTEKY